MSELRIIPADEAKELRENTTPSPWELVRSNTRWSRTNRDELIPEYSRSLTIVIDTPSEGADMAATRDAHLAAAAPDLAHTVIEQAAQIKRLQEAVRDADWVAGELAGVELIPRLINREIITEEDMQ